MKPFRRTKRRRRFPLRLFLFGAGLACAIAYGFVALWLTWPMGAGPAGPSVFRPAFDHVWTARPVVLIGIGDSVTAGFGASSPSLNYFQRLVSNPPDEFPEMRGLCLKRVLPRLTARNLAISGSASLQHLNRQVLPLKRNGKDVTGIIVMTTGGNDLIHDYGRTPPREGAMFGATLAQARPWVASFEKRLEIMLRILEDRFPGGCHLFLANIYDPTDGIGVAWSAGLPAWKDAIPVLGAYNAAITRFASRHPENVHLVDLHAAFLGHGIYCRQFWRRHYRADDPHYWYHTNFEDPNDRGYDAARRLFLNEIAAVMSGSRPSNAARLRYDRSR